MALRPALSLVLRELLRGDAARAITLGEVARALGTVAASSDEIEALFAALEAEGHSIADTASGDSSPSGSVAKDLAAVVTAARARASRGERPTVAALAADTGLPEDTVRAALRFAAVLAR
ncbi:MAG: hypothetical protein IPF92_21870 [Myxococcales bacterium]|nr:hypothetical protein [Myxococcales bacterium]